MIADLASIATLILFVFYFIGRIITIFNNEKIYTDLITIESKDFYDDRMQIVEEWKLEEDYYNKVFLTTTEGIRDIRLFEYRYDSEMNEIGKTLIKEKKFLNVGHTIEIQTTIPEIRAKYKLVYTTQDFKQVTYVMLGNMKNGVTSELVKPLHTTKSVMYYLFR